MKNLSTLRRTAIGLVVVLIMMGCKKNSLSEDAPSGDYYIKFKLNGEEVLFDHGVLGWYEEYMDRGNVVYRFYFNNYPQQGDSGEKLNLDLYSKTPLKTNKKYKSADSADYEDWVASGQFDIFEDLRLYYEGPQFMKYLYITSSVEDSEAATVEFTEITDNYLKGKFSGTLSSGVYELPNGNADSEIINEVKITEGEFFVPSKDLGN